MSDVPTQGVSSLRGGSSVPSRLITDSKDVEDIDRELEAYLEEKKSGKRIGFDHTVDDQLSQIREKLGARVAPTKESEKPREVEEIKRSHHDASPVPARETSNSPSVPGGTGVRGTSRGPVPSHDELIRSLEEKYSAGAQANASAQKETQAASAVSPSVATQGAIGGSQHLVDFRESIEPIDNARIQELLNQASALSLESQTTLSETFLARFKRNKERKELFTKTQIELEAELERFIHAQASKSTSREATEAPPQVHVSPPPKEEVRIETPKEPATPPEPTPAPSRSFDVLSNQKREQEMEQSVPTKAEFMGDASLGEKYKTYLSKLSKKLTVLLYDPEKGFVRKTVDPSDGSLVLSYSVETSSNSAVLTVFDTRGNELGIFKTPLNELGI